MTAFADYILTREFQATDGGLLTLSSPTTVVAAATDSGTGSVSIGFTFNFAGVDYTTATASSDGTLRFAGADLTYFNTNFDGSYTSIMLAPWWSDLKTSDTGYVRYEVLGSAPSRVCVVEWKCYGRYNHTSSNGLVLTFQVVLRETSNNIEFRYAATASAGSPPASGGATVGARIDTTGGATGKICEFSELTGTPDANGGIRSAPVSENLSPVAGNHWPADPTNVLEGAAFNYHFSATVAPPADSSDHEGDGVDGASTLYEMDADGAPVGDSGWFDILPAADGSAPATLQQLVWLALFSDRLAEPGDGIPDGTTDRRGWWVDAFEGEPFGSRLWLLGRAKLTGETVELARRYASEALAVLVDDGVCSRVEVEAERQGDRLAMAITVYRDDGTPVPIEYPDLWSLLTGGSDG